MDKEVVKSLPALPGVYIFKNNEKIIYIGKAKDLKRRVTSYFDLHLAPKTASMVSEANNLSFITVTSEFEALLLEAKLIRGHKPKYNVISKDDKHPLYIVITKEKFPRVLSIRKQAADNLKLLAKFGPFPSSNNVKYVLKMLRRIFPFSDHKIGKRKCIYAHLGLCDPCPSEIANNQNSIIKQIKIKKYNKNIKNIKTILSGKITKVKENLKLEMNILSKKQKYEEALKIRDQIARLEYITSPRISSSQYLENPNLINDLREKELASLGELVKLKKLHRIECFDIAHISGVLPTASMVVLTDGEIDKQEYRHFKIKQTKGNSDYDSMEEIARRRLKNLSVQAGGWPKPNLIIVDGGVGQVNAFKKIIKSIPVVGVAKKPDRLIIDANTKIKLQGLALQLVQRLRDEAHRFARAYHHKLLAKSLIQ